MINKLTRNIIIAMNRRNLLKNLAVTMLALYLANNLKAGNFLSNLSFAEQIAKGPFQSAWQSLKQYKTPEWYKDAKFETWAHWGAQCLPEQGDWYARFMYDDIYAGWLHWHMKTLHPLNQSTYNLMESPWGGNCAIPQFINTYDPNDKRLKQTWIMGQQYAANGDSLFCNLGADKMGQQLNFINFVKSADYASEDEGYRMGKYEIKMGAKGQLSNDVPIFRLADIMLMKAECLLRTSDAGGAAVLVTEVRKRSFGNPAEATVTGAQLLQNSNYQYGFVENGVITEPDNTGAIQYGRFLDELGWEFAAEIHRRPDLIRFGVFTTKTWLSHRPNGDYRTLFPIPENQLKNNTNLGQNPGY